MTWKHRSKSNKYGVALKAQRTCDGITFDSKGEMKRWQQLKLLEKSGQIFNLERQVRFPLKLPDGTPIKFKSGRVATFVANFIYFENGVRIVEDFKGVLTPESKLKHAVFEACMKVEVKVTR